MAQTKTVTAHEFVSVRTNDDGTQRLVVDVTYDDASTDRLEFDVDKRLPQ